MVNLFLLLVGLANGYYAGLYAFTNTAPDKILVVTWGFFAAFSILASVLKKFIIDRLRAKAENRYKEITEPIMNNINLTDQEKKERLQMALEYEMQKILKQAGGKNERSN
jgi:hypothetical protein